MTNTIIFHISYNHECFVTNYKADKKVDDENKCSFDHQTQYFFSRGKYFEFEEFAT